METIRAQPVKQAAAFNGKTFDDFWLFYLTQHSKPATRRWHFVGTCLAVTLFALAALHNWWLVLAAPLCGYSIAWYSHFCIEGNKPATFGHPLWSLICDFRMAGLTVLGKLDKEIERGKKVA